MNPKRRATVVAACLVVAGALWSMERSAAQSPEVEPPPSVAVIDQRLLETAQDQSLDDNHQGEHPRPVPAGAVRAGGGGPVAGDGAGLLEPNH